MGYWGWPLIEWSMRKSCFTCGVVKDLSEFGPRKAAKDRHEYSCRSCLNEKARKIRLADPERVREIGRRSNRKRTYEQRKKEWLKRLYGITLDEYRKIWRSQSGLCKICKGLDSRGFELSVDHDHETNQIRGLLCQACNRALGLMRDDPKLLRKGAEYLEWHQNTDGR